MIYDIISADFESPVTPYPFQLSVLAQAAPYERVLLELGVGAGKTFCSIWLSLYHSIANGVEQIICLVPAQLVTQWGSVWEQFGVEVLTYQGTPTQRGKMEIESADVVVMSHNIFRQEFLKKLNKLLQKNSCIIYDESQNGLRKTGNNIWRFLNQLARGNRLIGLSATPVSAPGDTFAVTKIFGGTKYKNRRMFDLKHVQERDFFQQVIAWKNLELMEEAMTEISVRIPKAKYQQLPEIIYDRVVYDLSHKHLKNYKKLLEDKLLETESGVLDVTESVNMFHILQQYITTPEGLVNQTLLDLLTVIFEEDDSPLLIFGNYRATNMAVLEHFGDVACGKWGDFTRRQQENNLQQFYNKEKKILVGNPASLGVGTDGIQNVCYRAVFVEMPLTSKLFEQSVGRIHRNGQTQRSTVRCLTAKGTLQMQLYNSMLWKDELIQQIIKEEVSLRKLFDNRNN